MGDEAPGFADPSVAAAFAEYPEDLLDGLMELRALVYETAAQTPGVGRIEEALKWGQPSYLTPETRSGTTLRLGRARGDQRALALLTHCQTSLVDDFRRKHGDSFEYDTTRAVHVPADIPLPEGPLREFIRAALTYHAGKRAPRSAEA